MENRGLASRLPGALFGLVAVATIALLILGYGVAVGIGAACGFALGLIAFAATFVLASRTPERSWSFLSRVDGADEPTPEAFARLHDVSELADLELGPVLHVSHTLQAVDAANLTVQLITVEWHAAGLQCTFDVRSGIGVGRPASFAISTVSDDRGTVYRSIVQQASAQGRAIRFVGVCVPSPPVDASTLRITIEEFIDPWPQGAVPSIGPWPFDISLETLRRAD